MLASSVVMAFIYACGSYAKAPASIITDIEAIRSQIRRVECALDHFGDIDGKPESVHRNWGALAVLYKQQAELDILMEDLVDNLQQTHSMDADDSLEVLYAFGELGPPLTDTLDTFANKHCDFIRTVGPFLTHSVVGGNIKNTRCKSLQVVKALACRTETPYKQILHTAGSELDSQFQAVISLY